MTNLLHFPAISESGNFNAVIEVPAGTNHKIEIDHQTGEFKTSLRNGKPRLIDFLGYPLNYGFIPGTLMDKGRGGDGDPLDALIICESLPSASIVEFIPIAVLRLKDSDELDSKIIGVPVDIAQRTISATNYEMLSNDYPAIMEILVMWFLNYDKKNDLTHWIGWEDEQKAINEIKKWLL